MSSCVLANVGLAGKGWTQVQAKMLILFGLNYLLDLGRKELDMAGMVFGGEGGIRTPDTLSGMPVFKTGAINRSATSPQSPGPL